jgi:hypothetical protein
VLDQNNRFYLNFVYGGYNEYRQPRFETVYGGLDATTSDNLLPNGSFITTPGNVTVQKSMENRLQENRFFSIIAGGDNKLGDVDIDYKASYSQASQDQPYYNKYTFNSLPGTINGTVIYNNRGNNGDRPTVDFKQSHRSERSAELHLQ